MDSITQEWATCGCGKMSLTPGDRMGTLAGGGAAMKSFCFDCLTLLEVVDGAVKVTPMVPRVELDEAQNAYIEEREERGMLRAYADQLKAERDAAVADAKLYRLLIAGEVGFTVTIKGSQLDEIANAMKDAAAPATAQGGEAGTMQGGS